MLINIDKYKGMKFKCDKCGYTVSSDATSDFDVEDFQFCPYCGFDLKAELSKPQMFIREIACKTMEQQKNYSEDTCHMFSKGVQALCIALENNLRNLSRSTE